MAIILKPSFIGGFRNARISLEGKASYDGHNDSLWRAHGLIICLWIFLPTQSYRQDQVMRLY
jgi:hypothetical protein